jgi:hypothetical protein
MLISFNFEAFPDRNTCNMRKEVVFGIFIIAMGVWIACQQPAQEQRVDNEQALHPEDTLRYHSASENHFNLAEVYLMRKEFRNAEAQLHEGIVAYRGEFGRVRGEEAAKINKSIWILTRIRTRLKHGEMIKSEELHVAVVNANALQRDHRLHAVPVKKGSNNTPLSNPAIQK